MYLGRHSLWQPSWCTVYHDQLLLVANLRIVGCFTIKCTHFIDMMLQVFCLKCITSRRIILMLYAKESVAEEI